MELHLSFSEGELRVVLSCILIGKFCPDERHLMIGHPHFERFVTALVSKYESQVGADKFRNEFYRDWLPEYEKRLLADQVNEIIRSRAMSIHDPVEVIKKISLPAVLSDDLLRDIASLLPEDP